MAVWNCHWKQQKLRNGMSYNLNLYQALVSLCLAIYTYQVQVGELYMVICIVIAGIIAMFSIFAFFGNAFSNTGGTAIPNMFHLMFGGSGFYQGYLVQWKQYGWLTFLFVLQILIMIVAIVAFVICYNIKSNYGEESRGVEVSVIMILLSLAALIISFFTLTITDINQDGYYNVQLGLGPILYSVLHIITIIMLIGGIVIYVIQPSCTYRPKSTSTYKPYSSQTVLNAKSSESAASKPNVSPKTTLSENEKIDLILKYKEMLDDGVITQEEFDKKKKELL